jgi:hypothetical protein
MGEPQPTLLTNFSVIILPHKQQTSTPMQLNEVFADTMQTPVATETKRSCFIKLNRLNMQKKAVNFRDLCEELRKADVHLFAAAEHNLDTKKFAATNRPASIPTSFYNNGNQLNHHPQTLQARRYKDRGRDSLGRWLWIELPGKNLKLITLVSAYQGVRDPWGP